MKRTITIKTDDRLTRRKEAKKIEEQKEMKEKEVIERDSKVLGDFFGGIEQLSGVLISQHQRR